MKEHYEAIVKREISMIVNPVTIIEVLKSNVLEQIKADNAQPSAYLFTVYNESGGVRLEAKLATTNAAMNAFVEFYEGYGSVEGRLPVHTSEIPFTYDQVFDDLYHSQVDEAVRKSIHKDFKGQGIIFNPSGRRTAGYKF